MALTAGSAFVFYNIAEISALPLVVEKDELTRATSANTIVEWIGENLGPAIGGVLISLRKSTAAGAVLAIRCRRASCFPRCSFSVVFASLCARRPAMRHGGRLLAEVREGIVWLFAHREIRTMALLAMALAVLFGPVQLAIIVLARQEFHAQPATIGLLFSMGGVAGILTTLTAPRFERRFSAGTIIVGGTFIWVLGLAGMAASGSVVLLGVGWAILTGVSGIRDVVSISYRLSLIPAEMQGRVNSVFRFVAWGLRPASLAFGGFAIGAFAARGAMGNDRGYAGDGSCGRVQPVAARTGVFRSAARVLSRPGRKLDAVVHLVGAQRFEVEVRAHLGEFAQHLLGMLGRELHGAGGEQVHGLDMHGNWLAVVHAGADQAVGDVAQALGGGVERRIAAACPPA